MEKGKFMVSTTRKKVEADVVDLTSMGDKVLLVLDNIKSILNQYEGKAVLLKYPSGTIYVGIIKEVGCNITGDKDEPIGDSGLLKTVIPNDSILLTFDSLLMLKDSNNKSRDSNNVSHQSITWYGQPFGYQYDNDNPLCIFNIDYIRELPLFYYDYIINIINKSDFDITIHDELYKELDLIYRGFKIIR